jgi:hypothetical protein
LAGKVLVISTLVAVTRPLLLAVSVIVIGSPEEASPVRWLESKDDAPHAQNRAMISKE